MEIFQRDQSLELEPCASKGITDFYKKAMMFLAFLSEDPSLDTCHSQLVYSATQNWQVCLVNTNLHCLWKYPNMLIDEHQ